jgi:hypothetical protein
MFVPNRTRVLRDISFVLLILQGGVDFVSVAFGGARGGISRAAAGIHAALAVISLAGFYGVLCLKQWPLVLHFLITLG